MVVGMCLAAAVLIAGVPVMATADEAGARDRRQWGKDGRFDLARTTHGHGRERPYRPARLKHSVEFHRAFKARAFDRRGSLWLTFPDKDRWIWVDYERGEYRATMRSNEKGVVGHPKVWKSAPDTLSLSFPRRWLKRGLKRYRWRATSEWFPPCDDNGGGPVEGGATQAASCVALINEGPEMVHRV